MIQRAIRRLTGLPARRCRSAEEVEWVAMRDGVRLATYHAWPLDVVDAPTILIRTPYGVKAGLGPMRLIGRLIAESGYHCVSQDVRGRYASEGKFEPFSAERKDGGDTLDWLVSQPWSTGRVGLFGGSYLAYSAWAALAERPELVHAMALSIGSGDLYATFYQGGAFSFANALEWGVGVGDRENVSLRDVDLERGFAHRPIRDADRVAHRKLDWFREWVDHPRGDAFWQVLRPPIPEDVPPTVLIAGFWDFFLAPQLADWQRISAGTSDAHRLLIGPWAHGHIARPRWWRHAMFAAALQESIAHFDVHLRNQPDTRSPKRVRYFVAGADTWDESDAWPPAESTAKILHLRNQAGTPRLSFEPPGEAEESLDWETNPSDVVPTCGGALFGFKAGAKNHRRIPPRRDVLRYDTEPLDAPLLAVGQVRVDLVASVNAEDADFTAKLLDVDPEGSAYNVCDGILRARWRDLEPEAETPRFLPPGEPTRLCIDLGHSAVRFAAGHVIRLEIAASNFPRFDTSPGDRRVPAQTAAESATATRQTIHHAADSASTLTLGAGRQSETRANGATAGP